MHAAALIGKCNRQITVPPPIIFGRPGSLVTEKAGGPLLNFRAWELRPFNPRSNKKAPLKSAFCVGAARVPRSSTSIPDRAPMCAPGGRGQWPGGIKRKKAGGGVGAMSPCLLLADQLTAFKNADKRLCGGYEPTSTVLNHTRPTGNRMQQRGAVGNDGQGREECVAIRPARQRGQRVPDSSHQHEVGVCDVGRRVRPVSSK